MADGTVKIRLDVEGDQKIKGLADRLKELKIDTRAVELAFKSGKVTQDEAMRSYATLEKEINDVAVAGKNSTAIYGQSVTALQSLWHANNRVAIGFKSLATETKSANLLLREINQEQKLGNQILGKMSGTISGLSGIIGNELGGAITGSIAQFQNFEDSILAASAGMRTMGGTTATFGSILAGLATTIAVGAAALGGYLLLANKIQNDHEAAVRTLSELRGEYDGVTGALKKLSDARNADTGGWREWLVNLDDAFGRTNALTEALRSTIALQKEAGIIGAEKGIETARRQQALENIALAEKEYKVGAISQELLREAIRNNALVLQSHEDQLDLKLKLQALDKENLARANEQLAIERELRKQEADHVVEATKLFKIKDDIAKTIAGKVPKAKGLPIGLKGAATPEDVSAAVEMTFAEGMAQVDLFGRSAEFAMMQVGQSITSNIGQEFVDAFGIGHTMIGQFASAFISQMTSLASMGLIKGLFSLASGGGFFEGFLSLFSFGKGGAIMEPVFGVGTKTGQAYSFAEEGGEYVVNQNQMRALTSQNYERTGASFASSGMDGAIAGALQHFATVMDSGNWRSIGGRQLRYVNDTQNRLKVRYDY